MVIEECDVFWYFVVCIGIVISGFDLGLKFRWYKGLYNFVILMDYEVDGLRYYWGSELVVLLIYIVSLLWFIEMI